MSRLEPPAAHYVNAALGWMELGLPAEAARELDQLPAAWQHHPDVLELRWAVLAAQQCWDDAVPVAEALIEAAPDRVSGWLHRAYALRRATTGGLDKAWSALRPAADRFPSEVLVPYNLACYACQLNRLDEARAWLQQALARGQRQSLKRMALRDDDLRALWPEIRDW